MEYIIISITALIASGLTLFSGFGLGTLLMPVFAIFFPIEIAIALTAIVHLLNNIFKAVLLGKHASKEVVLKFGIPGIIFAIIGSYLLISLADFPPIWEYSLFNKNFAVMPVKLVIGLLMIAFSVFDLIPAASKIEIDKKYLPLGGALSGFFGGLSGHQGAFRSAFLIKSGLTKEAFVASGVVIAVLIDVTRIPVYYTHFLSIDFLNNLPLLLAAIFSAFIGVFIGSRLLKKVTLKAVQVIVAVMLLIIALMLIMGII